MSNIDAVKQIMGELRNLRNNQEEKVAGIEQQVKSLKEAQRLMEESVYRADSVEVTGTDSELKKFVNKDGSIRWTSGKTQVKTAAGTQTVTEAGLLDTDENLSNWHVEMKRLANDRMMVKSMLVGDQSTPNWILLSLVIWLLPLAQSLHKFQKQTMTDLVLVLN